MRKDFYTEQEMKKAIDFLDPLFDDNNFLFKEMIKTQEIYLESKRFTYIIDRKNKKKYRIMGNCVGSTIYIRDILNIDDPDTHLLS